MWRPSRLPAEYWHQTKVMKQMRETDKKTQQGRQLWTNLTSFFF